ncbi:NADP-dependent alcohol dehydrogenase [Marivirga sericea]|uniref:NADP-dependent alcohol dehydrogenase n=1 Tax=Marivirga sericea TaxID=1028 RepID=A0A1X7IE56_9BACT|nr:iron-containing alcohol dehydrogenase [Marivirga sericea]SMG12843.1 NADP-dependent alcohol dehydrogenase [Marivirga sericea]
MKSFEFKNPTKIIFGAGEIKKLADNIPAGSHVLLAYGGGSIKKNGIYDQVIAATHDFKITEFGGIEPNPHFETLMNAVKIIRDEQVDFILAVGGGSVIDGCKFLSAAAFYDGNEWDLVSKGLSRKQKKILPFGSVLTLPATGSEMNSGAVVTKASTQEKRTFGGPQYFPLFSICDPTVIQSLPKRQIANGIVDAYTHTLEQYLTYQHDAILQDRIAEGILETLIEIGPKVMDNPSDYKAASNFMWSATMALNGILRLGVPTDWATHMIAHELTALHGIDHARTLAIIAPNLYKKLFEDKKEKLVQYGKRVWGLTGESDIEIAEKAIEMTVSFFHSLGVDTKLSDYTSEYKETAQTVYDRFEERKWVGLGERQKVGPKMAKEIVEMSI